MTSAPPLPEPPVADWRNVSIRYPYARKPAVGPVDLPVRAGERVLLLGPSGSGKSTLLASLTGIIPGSVPAEVEGDIRIGGEPVGAREPAGWAGTVAHFFQDADQTLCGMRVEEEIAFALENRGIAETEIFRRVGLAMRRTGVPEDWRRRRTTTLSGGEKQLVALAATLVQEAELFVADEPTAHLAPLAAERLHALLLERDAERGVLIVDHRLDGLIGSVDRVVVLGEDGTILAEGAPGALFRRNYRLLTERGIWVPLASHLDAALRDVGAAGETAPLDMEGALAHLDPATAPKTILSRAEKAVRAFVSTRSAPGVREAEEGAVVVRLEGAACAPFLGPVILRGVDVAVHAGEVLGIVGANGAGKSTLAACLAGVLRLKAGRREGPAGGIAFQKPETQFTEGSVREEISASAGQDEADPADAVLAEWGLDGVADRHPFELSQGQKRRLALASLTVSDRWPLIILDEPLAGLDARWAARVEADIERLRAQGRAVCVITHDMDFALRACPRSIVVGEGGIMAEGTTAGLLGDADLMRRAGLAAPAIAPVMHWLERVAAC